MNGAVVSANHINNDYKVIGKAGRPAADLVEDPFYHGAFGLLSNGESAWKVRPLEKAELSSAELHEQLVYGGGMYVGMSDSIPLSRPIPDYRDEVCKKEMYNISELKHLAASVIITFHEEWESTLLRSVHSVLNRTPDELLYEILLVDDGSSKSWLQKPLDDYVKTLPAKVKLIRLKERQGVVRARLAAASLAKGATMVVLDSHVEVGVNWLEALLSVLLTHPNAFVTPQIDSIVSTDFSFTNREGIGCKLDFKWTMVEEAQVSEKYDSVAPVSSPVMAGGLWAAKRDFFFKLGGYDHQMDVWGSEHIEISFRTWMCGGEILCSPCSRVFHVFRRGSEMGYSIPLESIWKNRLRTAATWMGDFSEIVEAYNHHPGLQIGTFDHVWALKESLKCKTDFEWYLKNVSPNNDIKGRDDIVGLGEIVSLASPNKVPMCIDLLGSKQNMSNGIGLYPCYPQRRHRGRGQQGFLALKHLKEIRLVHLLVTDHERLCFNANSNSISNCAKSGGFEFEEIKLTSEEEIAEKKKREEEFDPLALRMVGKRRMRLRWTDPSGKNKKINGNYAVPHATTETLCLTAKFDVSSIKHSFELLPCSQNPLSHPGQLWGIEMWPNKKWTLYEQKNKEIEVKTETKIEEIDVRDEL